MTKEEYLAEVKRMDELRKAFVRGSSYYPGEARAKAEIAYPYPKKPTEKRLRVVELDGSKYRFNNGVLEFMLINGSWSKSFQDSSYVLGLVDLVNNPTEEVEIDLKDC